MYDFIREIIVMFCPVRKLMLLFSQCSLGEQATGIKKMKIGRYRYTVRHADHEILTLISLPIIQTQ